MRSSSTSPLRLLASATASPCASPPTARTASARRPRARSRRARRARSGIEDPPDDVGPVLDPGERGASGARPRRLEGLDAQPAASLRPPPVGPARGEQACRTRSPGPAAGRRDLRAAAPRSRRRRAPPAARDDPRHAGLAVPRDRLGAARPGASGGSRRRCPRRRRRRRSAAAAAGARRHSGSSRRAAPCRGLELVERLRPACVAVGGDVDRAHLRPQQALPGSPASLASSANATCAAPYRRDRRARSGLASVAGQRQRRERRRALAHQPIGGEPAGAGGVRATLHSAPSGASATGPPAGKASAGRVQRPPGLRTDAKRRSPAANTSAALPSAAVSTSQLPRPGLLPAATSSSPERPAGRPLADLQRPVGGEARHDHGPVGRHRRARAVRQCGRFPERQLGVEPAGRRRSGPGEQRQQREGEEEATHADEREAAMNRPQSGPRPEV